MNKKISRSQMAGIKLVKILTDSNLRFRVPLHPLPTKGKLKNKSKNNDLKRNYSNSSGNNNNSNNNNNNNNSNKID